MARPSTFGRYQQNSIVRATSTTCALSQAKLKIHRMLGLYLDFSTSCLKNHKLCEATFQFTTQQHYWQRETSRKVKSCLLTMVKFTILHKRAMRPIFCSSRREINSMMFKFFHGRFPFDSVFRHFYALVPYTSTKKTVGHSSISILRISYLP